MMWKQMSVWRTIMVVVGMTQSPMSLHARILSVGEFVSAHWLMEYSLKEMVLTCVKKIGQGDNNGGCWHETGDGHSFSACSDSVNGKCACPPGFKGAGVKSCEDIDECKEKKACLLLVTSTLRPTWATFTKMKFCISKRVAESRSAWTAVWIIILGLSIAAVGAYIVYKYRIRTYMDSEIRAIMAQYMPLDDQNEVLNHMSFVDV